MDYAIKTKDYHVLFSTKKIRNINGTLVSDDNIKKHSSIEDIVEQLKFNQTKSVALNKNEVYEVTKNVNKITKNEKDLAKKLIDCYIQNNYLKNIGIVKNNKILILDKNDNLFDVIKKASKNNLPKSSKKKLTKKTNEIIDTKFSKNPFFKKTRINKQTKDAMKIKESTFSSKIYNSVNTCFKKSLNSFTNQKKYIQKELDRMFFYNKRQDLIMKVRSNNNIQKTELADKISKAINSKEYFVFKNIPYIAVSCSIKDINKVTMNFNTNLNKYNINNNFFKLIQKTQRSFGLYIPELYLEIAKDNKFLKYKNVLKDQGWNLRNIRALDAWKITKGFGSTTLVIDTGIDYRHQELSECFDEIKGFNFINNTKNPMDDNGHGTHVAGIIAGYSVGVSPDSKLVAAKVLDKNGSGSNTDLIRAIDYAINENYIDVVNMSLGSSSYSYALNEICSKAYKNGLILCAAAGNEGYGAEYPAACSGVISVAAVDYNNNHATFSNIDSSVDISAPGVSIFSTYLNNGYKQLSGTSMACPHATGVSNLCVSVKNNLDNRNFEKLLDNTSLILGAGESYQREKYGMGLIQADKLVNKINNSSFIRWKKW
ncbi:MAG: S8 family peptidase [Nanoarchaeota archaeon]